MDGCGRVLQVAGAGLLGLEALKTSSGTSCLFCLGLGDKFQLFNQLTGGKLMS